MHYSENTYFQVRILFENQAENQSVGVADTPRDKEIWSLGKQTLSAWWPL